MINFMMGLVVLSIAIVLGILSVEFYTQKQAVDAGLQQCLVEVDGKNQIIWAKDCN